MFKLVIISAVVAMAVAKPGGNLLSPVIGKLVSEKTIESHGNSVIHSSAPVVQAAAAVPYVAAAVPVAAKAAVPVVQPVVQPVVHPVVPVATKTVVQPVVPVAAKAAIVAEKSVEAYGHSVVHTAPVISYAAAPLVIPAASVELAAAAPVGSLQAEPLPLEKAAESKPKESEGEKAAASSAAKAAEPQVDATLIQEYSPIYHEQPLAYAAPALYYSAYPAVAPYEKTITSYGHTVFHHGA